MCTKEWWHIIISGERNSQSKSTSNDLVPPNRLSAAPNEVTGWIKPSDAPNSGRLGRIPASGKSSF